MTPAFRNATLSVVLATTTGSLRNANLLTVLTATPQFVQDHFRGLVVTPLRILMILTIAITLRALIRRGIKRLTGSTVETEVPLVIRPLSERVEFLENAGLLSERRRQRAETIGSILRSLTSVVVFGVAGMLVLGELDVNLGPILASAGILGFAVGFGAQNLVKDFLSGIFMLLEDQYGVGDVIDLGEASGTVEEVGLRTTRLRDVYGTVWYVRNGEINRVGNKSQGYAQVVLDTPVPAAADVDRAGLAIKEAADELWRDEEWAGIVLEEPQLLGIEQVTDEGVVLRLTVKTEPLQQWRVGRELRRRVKDRLDAGGIDGPETGGSLHVDAVPPPPSAGPPSTSPRSGAAPADPAAAAAAVVATPAVPGAAVDTGHPPRGGHAAPLDAVGPTAGDGAIPPDRSRTAPNEAGRAT